MFHGGWCEFSFQRLSLVSWAEWRQVNEPSCNWRWRHGLGCFHLQARKSVSPHSTSADWHPGLLTKCTRLLIMEKGPMEGLEDVSTEKVYQHSLGCSEMGVVYYSCPSFPSSPNWPLEGRGSLMHMAAVYGNGGAWAGWFLRTWH